MKLDYNETKLIELYRQLSEEEQDRLLQMVILWLDHKDSDNQKKSIIKTGLPSTWMTGRRDDVTHSLITQLS